MTFGDSVPAFTASPSGLVNGDSLGGAVSGLSCQSLDGNGHPVSSSTPPGNYSITCSYTSSPNYSISLVPGTLTIHPAVITVTADNKSMGYGAGAFPQFTATYSGKNTSGVTGTLSCVAKDGQSNPIQPSAPAGNYSIDCSGSQLTAPTGYTLSYVPGTLTIDAAPLGIVANNKTMTYGGAVPAFDAAINGLVNGDSASVVTGLTCGAVDAHGNPVSQFTPAGNYTIMCSGASAANYAIVYTSGTLTIKPAPLLITANNQTAIYRGTLPALTWTGSGWVNGEGPGALTTQPTCTTVTTTNPVGTYAINCSGAVDPNYAITYAPGKLFITYAICPLYSQTAPNNRGSTIPIKVQICDAAKKNLSTSSITLKALTVTGPVSNVPKPSGTSNPGNIFRYDSQILGYIYNLDSSPYPKGTYQLTFSVAGDPLNHTVGFVIG
jgi:hypothetical protein